MISKYKDYLSHNPKQIHFFFHTSITRFCDKLQLIGAFFDDLIQSQYIFDRILGKLENN